VVEKEAAVAAHQSGHNSGVLHAGIYYPPGSLKARLCREGKAALEAFADAHAIPWKACGKVVVALDETELPRLDELHRRALANGVDDVAIIGPERLRELEPHAAGIRGLHSPGTGIIDFRRVALAYGDEVRARGGEILLGHEVRGLTRAGDEEVLATSAGDVRARFVIACAGLHSDRVAALTGGVDDLHVVPFRGDYYTLRPEARRYCRGLLYPLPDPAFPFLGVHRQQIVCPVDEERQAALRLTIASELDARSDEANVNVSIQVLRLQSQSVWMTDVVGIHAGDVAPLGSGDASVESGDNALLRALRGREDA
jgi:L-2-hydroxyglutarate oxidase LhgO